MTVRRRTGIGWIQPGRWRVAALSLLVACSGDPSPAANTSLTATTLLVTLSRDSLRTREVAQASVEGRDASGRAIPLGVGMVRWSTSDAAVATASESGRITATGVGATQVLATLGSLVGGATIRVFAVPVDAVVVTPLRSVLLPGESLQLVARAVDPTGGTLPGRPISWLSSDTTRATVDQAGRVTARAPGVVSIAAISEQVYSTVEVRVSGPPGPVATVTLLPAALGLTLGESGRLSTLLEDADGNEATDRPVTWESLAPDIATISPTGEVTAIARGTARIRATCEGQVGFGEVTVADLADSITVTFAEPIKDDIIGDTLLVFAEVRSRNEIVRVHARLNTTERFEADLVATPIGFTGARIAWKGAIDVTFLHYGAYQLVLTSYDALGNSSVTAQSFKRGARAGNGGTTLPPRSK